VSGELGDESHSEYIRCVVCWYDHYDWRQCKL